MLVILLPGASLPVRMSGARAVASECGQTVAAADAQGTEQSRRCRQLPEQRAAAVQAASADGPLTMNQLGIGEGPSQFRRRSMSAESIRRDRAGRVGVASSRSNELMQGRRRDQTTHCRSTRIGPRIFAGRGPVQGLVQGGVGGEHGAVMRVRSGNSTGVLAPAVRGRRAFLNICLRRAHQFADGICTPDTCHGAV